MSNELIESYTTYKFLRKILKLFQDQTTLTVTVTNADTKRFYLDLQESINKFDYDDPRYLRRYLEEKHQEKRL